MSGLGANDLEGADIQPIKLPAIAAWVAVAGNSRPLLGYIREQVPFPHAFAVARLLWPRFIESRGCVFVKDISSVESLDQWWSELGGDIPAVESMLNHLHLWDLFDDSDSDVGEGNAVVEASLREFAELIAETWRLALSIEFPGRRFVVETSDGPNEYGPSVTFHSV